MKKMLFVTLKTQIIITLGYTLFSFYAGANPLNMEEAKEDTTIPMNQVSDIESDQADRNGFATVGLTPSCSFPVDFSSDCAFNLDLSTNYGVVFGKSAIADAGILEGTVNIDGNYSGRWSSHSYLIGVSFGIDINFIKNDGINKMIPGLFLGAGVAYNKLFNNSDGRILGGASVGAILKAFISKQLAIVPALGVGYSRGSFTQINNTTTVSTDDLKIFLGLGLRYYF